MYMNRPTAHMTHLHPRECAKDMWFCYLLEGWAKGNHPTKEKLLSKIKKVEAFINRCSDSEIEKYRLICVPWKDDKTTDKTPARIALDEYGGAVWKYEGREENEEREENEGRKENGGGEEGVYYWEGLIMI